MSSFAICSDAPRRVSVAGNGRQGNGPSDLPDLSRHGRVASFVSETSNLVCHDTNRVSDSPGSSQVEGER
jgi:hypothetical protein